MRQTILQVLSSETPSRSSHDVNVKILACSYFGLFLEQLSFKFFLTLFITRLLVNIGITALKSGQPNVSMHGQDTTMTQLFSNKTHDPNGQASQSQTKGHFDGNFQIVVPFHAELKVDSSRRSKCVNTCVPQHPMHLLAMKHVQRQCMRTITDCPLFVLH